MIYIINIMKEFNLIEIYGNGRELHFLPNSKELNLYMEEELKKICIDEKELSLWLGIYKVYSQWGLLEKCYQLGMSRFSWYDINLLLHCTERFKLLTKQRDKFLKNKRSTY